MDAERDGERLARQPWSVPVLRLISSVDAEASEGLTGDLLVSS